MTTLMSTIRSRPCCYQKIRKRSGPAENLNKSVPHPGEADILLITRNIFHFIRVKLRNVKDRSALMILWGLLELRKRWPNIPQLREEKGSKAPLEDVELMFSERTVWGS